MKQFVYFWMILVSLAGCTSLGAGPVADGLLVQVDDIITGAPQTLAAVAEFNGKPALLYANKDNRITFQYGEQRQQLDGTAPVTGGNRYQLHTADQKLLAMWWSHQDGKNLYASVSDDAGKAFTPVGIVNTANGVLPPYGILRGAQETLGAVYLDEREGGYKTYFNRSTDFGKTWGRPDQRLDIPPPKPQTSYVQEPHAVESGSTWFAAWADTERTADGTGYRILGRRSEDAGLHWSEPVVIYRPQKFISSLTVRAQGNTIVIAADELSRGIFAISSTDQGRNWRTSDFVRDSGFVAGSDGASNSGIDIALAGERAHVVWMQDRAAAKTKIMRASLDTTQAQWLSGAQRLDTKGHENTRSMVPTLLAAAQGPVWAAWVDYRDIRPNVYLSHSADQGLTWSPPKAFLKPGEVSAGFPKLIPWGQGVALAYEVYPTERPTEGHFYLRKLSVRDDGRILPELYPNSQVSDAERKVKLEKRVESLWKARVAGDYAFAYDVFDFAYKAATTKKTYVENTGVITYQTYSVEGISVAGTEATVKMKLKYEVKPTMLPGSGKPIKLDLIEVEATNTWVWVDSDWYLMYSPAIGQANLRY